MDNTDFTNREPNEVLSILSAYAAWLAVQFKLGTETLPSAMILDALQNGDGQKKYFLFAPDHLTNLASATAYMKLAPTPPEMNYPMPTPVQDIPTPELGPVIVDVPNIDGQNDNG